MVQLNRDQAIQRAQCHINAIRREAGLDGTNGRSRNVENLQNALHTLADELYQKSTHFLLELIQNADDNEYDDADPSISLTYQNRRLRIDCNERGFSEKNVEAICRVGSSTKAGANRATAYVGEKGIGFKSVFKAADVVWISSNCYTFKFDKKQVLGMIAPIWEPFPEPSTPLMTSMLLQLSPDFDEARLLSDLREFDPRMLMFLRRLRTVKITIRDGGLTWQTTLSKTVSTSHGETAIELNRDGAVMKYLVSSHSARNLPVEPKRPGASESQILLAFPDVVDQPLTSQKVYAFLPVRDYGFKFLLQGDFLLSASREDVLSDSPWNRALRREFVGAFVAVTSAYSHGQLCYIWPRFIPFNLTQQHFFEPARREIIKTLSRQPVLKSRSQELMMPSSLTYVPLDFCDRDGVPMTSSPRNDKGYLCHRYDVSLHDNLEALGVTKMTAAIFLEHLDRYIDQNTALFQGRKSAEWHTRLAEVLLKLSFDTECQEKLRKLPIIPLNDGRWVSAEEKNVFLPQEAEGCMAPEGLAFRLVREDAANNPTARALYLQLGLKVFGQDAIADYLLHIHRQPSFNPKNLTVTHLISQAVFLFRARVHDYEVRYLWLATTDGSGRCRAESAYLPSQAPFAASNYFAGRNDIYFIHPHYLNAVEDDLANWQEWLENIAKISILPRLTQLDGESPYSFGLSRHFALIMQTSRDFLVLLRDNWGYYSRWLEDDAGGARDDSRKARQACREKLRNSLQEAQVQCVGGPAKALREVFLPIPELVQQANGQVPFVDVDDPLDPRWQRLKILGLGVEGDVCFYLRCLEAMSGTKDVAVIDRAALMLEQVQARCSELPDLVKQSFNEKPLVCVPNKRPGGEPRWVKVQDCLWSGPECLRRFVALKNIYPSCQRLFRDFFLRPDAGIADLVREAKLLNVGDPLSYIKALFLEIEKHLEKDEMTTAIDSLQTHYIWPVYNTSNEGQWDMLGCAKNLDAWFIADRTHLLESFCGIVPLLAFQVEDVLKIPLLIRKLGGDKRRLTRAVTSIAETVGSFRPDLNRQADLRSRAEFIARLIPKKEHSKKEKAVKLKSLQAFSTTRVIQKWSVKVASENRSGRSKDGNVVLSTEHNRLEIYFKNGYFESNKVPRDLIEAIASFCGIEDKGLFLLAIALQEDIPNIQRCFQEHGVPTLNLDDETEDEFEDIDDFDPRRSQGRSTGVHQNGRKSTLKADLVRRFISVGMLATGLGSRDISFYHGSNNSDEAFVMTGGFSSLGANDLYMEEEEDDDTKSVASRASSTFSGSTLGGNKMKIFAAIPARMVRRSTIFAEHMRREADDNLEFIGQKKVSEELRRMLNAAYSPDDHWTHSLRARNGHKNFVREQNNNGKPKLYASFTVNDTSKMFTRYVAECYPEAKRWIKRPPVYHLDVRTTKGDLNSEFSYSNDQWKMARIYTIPESTDTGIPTDVYFLVRVFNADKDPEIQFLLDPWSLYLQDMLRLKAEKEYRASLHGLRA
ncbi:uncharacterized protein Z519_06233 [Cladophialophora bantiana CBS 173.52]|uniref:Protein NO VEIN C-terminal domain-containing protein n=1 Tax=Cladophialophora bantiana (strain ATCC 10958 / CBS 173.52 / CDC B-1940 / NIH 8579) TaxID=1442370 RepID=A0A0D2HK28_CLAB1|nr:uncharacterized protein Z519_06233 [Cladophialophora bantiana CBS 173.52]KIW93628.1 hypothetical protein Z519_06233 [Cladophialophora bantiana CBS 173.52]